MIFFSNAKLIPITIRAIYNLYLKQRQIVPKIATLLVHDLADVVEEIMLKAFGGASDGFAVEMLFLKHFVYVCPVAMHLLGEPTDGSTLLFENCFDDMTYVKICHLIEK